MKKIKHKFVNPEELDIEVPYYDLHKLSKMRKAVSIKKSEVIKKLKEKGYKASKTLLCGHAIKTDAPFKLLENSFQKTSN